MANSEGVILAIGGAVLVTWYGLRRLSGSPAAPRLRSARSDREYRLAAQVALEAEFRRTAPAASFPGGAVECASCGALQHAGFLYCEYCGGETLEADDDDLRPSTTTAPQEPIGASDDLACVHIAANSWKASLLRSYLANNGIPCIASGHMPEGLYQLSATPLAEVRLLVRAADLARARDLLRELGSRI